MVIIFRADGDSTTGLGHIMRSAALLQILQPHFSCTIVTKNPEYFPLSEFSIPPDVQKISLLDPLEEAIELSKINPGALIVLDGYQFNTAYQIILKKAGRKIVYIDDLVSGHYVADAVINHSGSIVKTDYSHEAYTNLYLGPSYALVKPIFNKNQITSRDLNEKRLFISLGGADPDNNTALILNELNKNLYTEINVILGSANRYVQTLKDKYNNSDNIKFHQGLSSAELCSLMQKCSYAILSPSTICYEYMSVGGIVYLYQIADNQKNIKKYFLQEKMAFSFEDRDAVSNEDKLASLQKQRIVFDGKSADRLLEIFTSYLK